MPYFGSLSLERLATVHPALQDIANDAIQIIDFSIVCGERGEADQEAAFASGASKLHYPHSAHNKKPARAFDFQPYPKPAKNRENWKYGVVAGVILSCAFRRGYKLRLGGDWGWDAPHVELVDA